MPLLSPEIYVIQRKDKQFQYSIKSTLIKIYIMFLIQGQIEKKV